MTRDRADNGSAAVDFVFVSVLVVALFLLVLQVALALHVRNVLVASAAEGARYAADADRSPADGEQRTREVVGDSLSPGVAGRMTYRASEVPAPAGEVLVEVEVDGPLPVVFLPAGPLHVRVRGHALEERR